MDMLYYVSALLTLSIAILYVSTNTVPEKQDKLSESKQDYDTNVMAV